MPEQFALILLALAESVGAALGIAGALLIAAAPVLEKRGGLDRQRTTLGAQGFWVAANALWIITTWAAGSMAGLTMFSVYFLTAVWGVWNWRNAGKAETNLQAHLALMEQQLEEQLEVMVTLTRIIDTQAGALTKAKKQALKYGLKLALIRAKMNWPYFR